MRLHYLEIVAKDVEAVCASYGVPFGEPQENLGNARTASLGESSTIGVRAPMHEAEEPVVRPYWLVDDIESALSDAVKNGAEVMHPPLEIPTRGVFAIYRLGGAQHGLWQL